MNQTHASAGKRLAFRAVRPAKSVAIVFLIQAGAAVQQPWKINNQERNLQRAGHNTQDAPFFAHHAQSQQYTTTSGSRHCPDHYTPSAALPSGEDHRAVPPHGQALRPYPTALDYPAKYEAIIL